MAQAPFELEKEMDVIHVSCGYHCEFKGYNEDQTMAFYACAQCGTVFPIGYILPNAQTQDNEEPQANATESIESTTEQEPTAAPVAIQPQEETPTKSKTRQTKTPR